jgi:hypothetical protein
VLLFAPDQRGGFVLLLHFDLSLIGQWRSLQVPPRFALAKEFLGGLQIMKQTQTAALDLRIEMVVGIETYDPLTAIYEVSSTQRP